MGRRGVFFHGKAANRPATVFLPAFGLNQVIRSKQTAESYAAFAQGTYSLTDNTSLTVGLRYTDEKKTLDSDGELVFFNPAFVLPANPYRARQSASRLTWRLALDHKLGDDVLLYASYNRGFKSGGFNAFALNVPNEIVPETLDAFELGVKSEFADNKVRLNVAGFYYDFRNIQLNTYVNSAPAVYNGDQAYIYGLDADLTAAPVEGLTLTAGLSLLHARFGDFPINTTVVLPTGGLTLGPQISAKDKRLPQTPDVQFNIGAQYHLQLENGSLDFAADYFHSGRWFEAPENRLRQPSYSLINASVAWNFGTDENWSLRIWGRNLNNARYANQLTAQVNDLDFVNPGDPRTYGATLSVKF